MVAVVGGVGPFAGSIGFAVEQRHARDRRLKQDRAMLG
jgi:hypothetical protein